jgi:hypothetical protein
MSSKGKEFHFGKYFSIYYVRLFLMYFSSSFFFFLCFFHDSIATAGQIESSGGCEYLFARGRRKIPPKVGASVAVVRSVVDTGRAGYLAK